MTGKMVLALTCMLAFVGSALGDVSMFKLSQGTDPTKMTITWSSTAGDTQASTCKYGRDVINGTPLLNMMAEGMPDSYQFQSYDTSANKLAVYSSPQFHYVVLTNLVPGARYYYQCGDFGTVKPVDVAAYKRPDVGTVTSFKTLPAVGSATDLDGNYLTFGVTMDSGTNTWAKAPVTYNAATSMQGLVYDLATETKNKGSLKSSDNYAVLSGILANTDAPVSMVLHAGDMSYADCVHAVWDDFDLTLEQLSKKIPMMFSAGNHEQEVTWANGGSKTAFTAMEKVPYIPPPCNPQITPRRRCPTYCL